jgi:hypothetical protein
MRSFTLTCGHCTISFVEERINVMERSEILYSRSLGNQTLRVEEDTEQLMSMYEHVFETI